MSVGKVLLKGKSIKGSTPESTGTINSRWKRGFTAKNKTPATEDVKLKFVRTRQQSQGLVVLA